MYFIRRRQKLPLQIGELSSVPAWMRDIYKILLGGHQLRRYKHGDDAELVTYD